MNQDNLSSIVKNSLVSSYKQYPDDTVKFIALIAAHVGEPRNIVTALSQTTFNYNFEIYQQLKVQKNGKTFKQLLGDLIVKYGKNKLHTVLSYAKDYYSNNGKIYQKKRNQCLNILEIMN